MAAPELRAFEAELEVASAPYLFPGRPGLSGVEIEGLAVVIPVLESSKQQVFTSGVKRKIFDGGVKRSSPLSFS